MIEKAGYTREDIPKTWDAFYDFLKEVQKKLRAQGERKVYALGFQLNTTGNDSNALLSSESFQLIAPDGNNAFHAKQIVMDLDGSLSTEVAIIKNQQDYSDIATMGLPLSND